MSQPRQVLPNKSWMTTRRCAQRQFLLRPDDDTNNAFLYCMIEAAQKFDIQLVLAQMMSNHKHESLHDPKGNIVEFYQRFHTHLAKCINVQRGRWENMWSTEPTCAVEAVDRGAWIDQLVYIATNPVKDGLVEKVHHWPGPKIVRALLEKQPLRAKRPRFFRADGPMPEWVEMTPTIPPELGDPDEIIAELKRRIAEVEEACARERLKTGRQVVGRRRVLRQSWRDSPTSHEPRRNLRPRVAARSKWARIERLQSKKEFFDDYRKAYARWRAGLSAVFPLGTYWLARFASVEVVGATRIPREA